MGLCNQFEVAKKEVFSKPILSLFLAEMAKDGSIFSIDIKLDSSNYREWAFSVRTAVRAAGYDDHLTDDPPDEKENEATRET